MRRYTIIICMVLTFKTYAQTVQTKSVNEKNDPSTEGGYACIYSKSLHGSKTASGERFDKNKLTAAHRKYKLGTKVKVTNVKNNKSIVVTINDRGPFTKKYLIDLSPAAAAKLGFGYREGKAKVKLEKM